MGWSKEVADALAILERAYGSFVLVARAKDMSGVLVHAHSPTVGLVDDVARWLVAYRTTPPAPSRRFPAVQDPPCPGCKDRHVLAHYDVGKVFTTRVRHGPDEEISRRASVEVPVGSRGKVVSWTQYGSPLSVRLEFESVFYPEEDSPPGERVRYCESYLPCELEEVVKDDGCWIDGCGKPTRPAGGICENHERALAEKARR